VNPLSGENISLKSNSHVKLELPDLKDKVLLKLDLKNDIKS